MSALERMVNMSIWELFLVAVGLSMDAFAVSVCKGLSVKKLEWKHALTVGIYFGGISGFNAVGRLFLGSQFQSLITNFDHWIAFVLLALIGGNMIREALSKGDECPVNTSFSFRAMLPLAVATSIDALAVGVTFAFLQVQIVPAVSFIGVTTFVLSMIGTKAGNLFGAKYKSRAELFGGVILILMGLKILLEHLGVLG